MKGHCRKDRRLADSYLRQDVKTLCLNNLVRVISLTRSLLTHDINDCVLVNLRNLVVMSVGILKSALDIVDTNVSHLVMEFDFEILELGLADDRVRATDINLCFDLIIILEIKHCDTCKHFGLVLLGDFALTRCERDLRQNLDISLLVLLFLQNINHLLADCVKCSSNDEILTHNSSCEK